MSTFTYEHTNDDGETVRVSLSIEGLDSARSYEAVQAVCAVIFTPKLVVTWNGVTE